MYRDETKNLIELPPFSDFILITNDSGANIFIDFNDESMLYKPVIIQATVATGWTILIRNHLSKIISWSPRDAFPTISNSPYVNPDSDKSVQQLGGSTFIFLVFGYIASTSSGSPT